MLWYKSWLETRWRFVIGLVMLMLSACSTVLMYPEVMRLLPLAPKVDLGGEIGRRVMEIMELSSTYRGYVWSNAFSQNLPQMLAVFAAILGAGGLLSQTAGGGALFTLSLPVTRDRLLGVRAATGFAELFVLALFPSLVVWLLSPAIGESFGITDALVHAACMFTVSCVLFSLSFLLSTVFSDVWRPALIALGIAMAFALFEQVFRDFSFGLFRVMTGEAYFRGGGLPWLGLLTSVVASAALVYAATRNIARQDF